MTSRLPIPLAVFDQHIILLGKTRSGKSSKMRVMIEAELDRQVPVCIIDPKGDWWGLKSAADGKKAGYPVVIFGGAHGDIPINAQSGKAVAELVATGNRPCIIDLKGWTIADRTRFFIGFAETFFAKAKGRRILAIDEVHNFAPQTSGRVDPQTSMMLHWANRLASEGSGLGITLMSASQRPQKVHKDYVSSHETLIACRVIHKRDREAYEDWIEACGDDKSGDEVLTTVANMERKEAWVWAPEIHFGPKRITWPMFKTYDSFKPQAAKSRRLKGWAAVDLDEVRDKLATAIEENKAKDPTELRKQIVEKDRKIADLERQLKSKSTAPLAAAKPTKDAIGAAEKRGIERGQKVAVAAAEKTIRSLRTALEAAMKFIVEINAKDFFKAGGDAIDKKAVQKAITGATDHITRMIEAHLGRRDKQIEALQAQARRVLTQLKAVSAQDVTVKVDVKHNAAFTIAPTSAPRAPRAITSLPATVDSTLTKTQQAILDAIAWTELLGSGGASRMMVAFLADSSPKSSTFEKYVSQLKSMGYIIAPVPGMFALTDEGRARAAVPDTAPTHEAMMEAIARKLTDGQLRIVKGAVAVYPETIARDDLAAAAEMSATSSTFEKYLSQMRSLGLIVSPQPKIFQASERLFPVSEAA